MIIARARRNLAQAALVSPLTDSAEGAAEGGAEGGGVEVGGVVNERSAAGRRSVLRRIKSSERIDSGLTLLTTRRSSEDLLQPMEPVSPGIALSSSSLMEAKMPTLRVRPR